MRTSVGVGGSPDERASEKFKLAALRALRTLILGLAAAFPSAGAGTVVLSTSYWVTFTYACLAAVITAVVSLLQNLASLLPDDST